MACEKYLRAWYNEDWWNFHENGEEFVLRQFASWVGSSAPVLWDVGAHYGEWAQLAHAVLPRAVIEAFEIIPSSAERLPKVDWLTCHPVGLSSSHATVQVFWNKDHDNGSAIERGPSIAGDSFDVLELPVTTGDRIARDLGAPALLKIDVEGHEVSVLRGCEALLASDDAPWLIQFEYGDTFLPSGSTLMEIYNLLSRYSIGRLYPNHVDFKDYSSEDDHFRRGNMIAVRDRDLKKLLSPKLA